MSTKSAAHAQEFSSAPHAAPFQSGTCHADIMTSTGKTKGFASAAPDARRIAILDVHAFHRRVGDFLFSLIIAAGAIFFAFAFFEHTGWATRKLPDPVGLYILDQLGLAEWDGRRARLGRILKQGWIAPALCLAIVLPAAFFNLRASWKNWRWRVRYKQPGAVYHEIVMWLRGLEFIGWFVSYTMLVPVLGYLIATLIFGTLLPWRLGYRGARWMGICLISAFAIVLVFRTGLQIRTPVNIWLYDFLPAPTRSFMLRWF